jgi:hypothetical protein
MAPRPGARGYLVAMRAHYVVNTGRWDDSVLGWDIDLAGTSPISAAMDAFVRGYAALRRGDGTSAFTRFSALQEAAERGPPAARVLRLVLEGAMAMERSQREEGIRLLREATALEDGLALEFGPPDIVKPSHEVLGEYLLSWGRWVEAEREFERVLALAPQRPLSLRGLVTAAARAGHQTRAEWAYRTLRGFWQGPGDWLPTTVSGRP